MDKMISKSDGEVSSPKRKIHRYQKDKILDIVKEVCENYSYGEYTLESVCGNAGVPIRTWRDWWARYYANSDDPEHKWYFLAEVAALWKHSQRTREETLKMEYVEVANNMLIKCMKGWEYLETKRFYKCKKDENGQDIFALDRLTTKTKLVLPNARLIQFVMEWLVLKKYEKDAIVEKSNSEMSYYRGRSLEEIEAEIAVLRSDLQVV